MGIFKKIFSEAIEQNNTNKKLMKLGADNYMHIEYLGGHPKLKSGKVLVIRSENANELIIDDKPITVTGLEWDEKGKRSLGGAATGAVVAGLLTGGIGAIAGAAVGGRKQDNSLAVVTCNDGIVELKLTLEQMQKNIRN